MSQPRKGTLATARAGRGPREEVPQRLVDKMATTWISSEGVFEHYAHHASLACIGERPLFPRRAPSIFPAPEAVAVSGLLLSAPGLYGSILVTKTCSSLNEKFGLSTC